MEIRKMKAAVVGCGMISDIYIQSLISQFRIIEVAACTDLNQDRMAASAQKYGIKAMTFEELLADSSIEMVINLTNPAAHYAITKEALLHGKHVFSEKMIAVELEDGKELCQIAEEKHVRLGVAPDTFLGGGIQTAGYILEHGLIGAPLSAVVSLNRDYQMFGDTAECRDESRQ